MLLLVVVVIRVPLLLSRTLVPTLRLVPLSRPKRRFRMTVFRVSRQWNRFEPVIVLLFRVVFGWLKAFRRATRQKLFFKSVQSRLMVRKPRVIILTIGRRRRLTLVNFRHIRPVTVKTESGQMRLRISITVKHSTPLTMNRVPRR